MSTVVRPVGAQAGGHSRPQGRDDVEIIPVQSLFADRRAEPRLNTNKTGCLVLMPSAQRLPCRVLDQSASGARISLKAPVGRGAELWLIDPQENMVKRGAPAWVQANMVGLKFDLALKVSLSEARPARVPETVYQAWLDMVAPEEKPVAEAPAEDVFFLD